MMITDGMFKFMLGCQKNGNFPDTLKNEGVEKEVYNHRF
jgi:hypothetical protein